MHIIRSLPPVLALALVLAGCGTPPPKPEQPPRPDPELTRAATLYDGGDFVAAAALYRELANRATPQTRPALLLRAADAYRAAGDRETLLVTLAELRGLALQGTDALRVRLLFAESALLAQDATAALEYLRDTPPPDAGRELAARYLADKSAAYRLQGNALEAAGLLDRRDALLTRPAERLANQRELVQVLTLLSGRVLDELRPSPPGTLGGWMDLAGIIKREGHDPAAFEASLQGWRQRFPQHPVLPDILADYQRKAGELAQPADRIAVLLPRSGPYARAAEAVREGFLIARYREAAGERPHLRFYDTSDADATWPVYNQAVADGAQLVIGPLQKQAVLQLARAGELPVPVLALNQVQTDSPLPPTLYMYALSPDDEARQAAERAWIDGARRPILITPQNAWGDRMASAFETRWTELGGLIAGRHGFAPDSSDYSAAITELLHINQSEARHRKLQAMLGMRLEFEPRRRADVDSVFIAARPQQAQGLKPQLEFHHAADLPVYATSHAWDGELDDRRLADMRGMLLPDIPWLLDKEVDPELARSALAPLVPGVNGPYARLYAMGIDSYRLIPHLRRLQSSPLESLDGSTGNLHMDDARMVHRQLVWVRLDRPLQIIGFSPRLDLPAMPGEVQGPTPAQLPRPANGQPPPPGSAPRG